MEFRTQAHLKELIGESETERLEFKSSVDLEKVDDKNSLSSFIKRQIAPAVSGFLNSDGGNIIIGMEEDRDGVATKLSRGVPDSIIRADRLQQMIVDVIQPAVADLVSVNSIRLDTESEVSARLNAFCVTVRSGITAYQSSDKKYYARRAGQTVPMDDKDVRIRMLVGDKPRIDVRILENQHAAGPFVGGVSWDFEIRNVGIKTINRAFIHCKLVSEGLSPSSQKLLDIKSATATHVRDLQYGDDRQIGLMPGMSLSVQGFVLNELMFKDSVSEISLHAEVKVFIDDGPHFEARLDLMEVLRPIIQAGWKRPVG
jgi:hypothetical protein